MNLTRRLTSLYLLPVALFADAGSVQFNRDVRPILSDKCYTCHGPDPVNRKTKIRFDTEDGVKAAAPEIVKRVTSTNKTLRMPPAYMGRDALTAAEIDTLKRWLDQGTPWESHWSFIPPKPNPGASIDSLVLSRLKREGLHPSPEAGRATLMRRVALDLTGIPPTPAEVDAFVSDSSPGAYEKVVDRLLASPRFGEKMAVRWLDAARYADTNGYQSDGNRSMWRWRDWVIDAFNRNMPFDQFTVEQLAGDLLPNATVAQKIATGFNRNHRTNAEGGIVPEEFRVEYVADRAETTSTVWLGLTLGCARCHDHKYDPIKQRDFYRMFSFFNNIPEKGLVYNFGNDEPMIKAPTPEQEAKLAELTAAQAAAEERWARLRPEVVKGQARWEKTTRKNELPLAFLPSDGLVVNKPESLAFNGSASVDLDTKIANFDYLQPFTLAARVTPTSSNGAILSRVEDYFEGEGYGLYVLDGKIRLHIIKRWTDIGMRVETEASIPMNEPTHVAVTYDGYRYASGVHIYINGRDQKLKVLFDDLNYPLGAKVPFRIGGGGGPKLRFRGTIGEVVAYQRAIAPDEVMAISGNEPKRRELEYLERFAPARIREAGAAMEKARAERTQYYDSIQTVMVMRESATPRDAFVLKRGAYDAPGEKVTAGVPGFLPSLPEGVPANRLSLARWLVSPDNPLTARVIVNRYWQGYFGTGLVKTVEDFGSQGEAPSNQELLDYLATEFVRSGWDVKAMQKRIVMSATYRQASSVTPELLRRDPENRLLARGPRVRLGAEMVRDQALAASGLLVEKVGGPSVKPYQPAGLWQELAGGKGYVADHGDGLYRRSLYTFWKRTVAPPAMVNFDAPTRESCIVRENRTNTPLQALGLMNDVAYVEASRKLAERMMAAGDGAETRIGAGYRLVLGRWPKAGETAVVLQALRRFEARYASDPEAAETLLSQGESGRGAWKAGELAAYASVASLILNLDEAVTKQ